MKKMAICIPTYNRYESVARQLDFILNDIGCNNVEIDVYVRDNCSSMEQYESLRNYQKNNNGFTLHRNEQNLGLVGNLIAMFRHVANSYEYVWFVGDDDILLSGIVNDVLNKIKGSADFCFINHSGVEGDKCLMSSALPCGLNDDSDISLLDIFRHSGTTMMFVTACVYKTKKLGEALKCDFLVSDRLTAPFYWSFYCAQNGFSYIKEIKILNRRGATSWDDKAHVVFGFWLPIELFRLFFMNYKKLDVSRVAVRYIPTAIKRLLKLCVRLK